MFVIIIYYFILMLRETIEKIEKRSLQNTIYILDFRSIEVLRETF